MCVNAWVSLNYISSVHLFFRVCVSISDEGFVVAVPKLISLFVCLVGPCWWMINDFDWSVWRGEDDSRGAEGRKEREKQQRKTGKGNMSKEEDRKKGEKGGRREYKREGRGK